MPVLLAGSDVNPRKKWESILLRLPVEIFTKVLYSKNLQAVQRRPGHRAEAIARQRVDAKGLDSR